MAINSEAVQERGEAGGRGDEWHQRTEVRRVQFLVGNEMGFSHHATTALDAFYPYNVTITINP